MDERWSFTDTGVGWQLTGPHVKFGPVVQLDDEDEGALVDIAEILNRYMDRNRELIGVLTERKRVETPVYSLGRSLTTRVEEQASRIEELEGVLRDVEKGTRHADGDPYAGDSHILRATCQAVNRIASRALHPRDEERTREGGRNDG